MKYVLFLSVILLFSTCTEKTEQVTAQPQKPIMVKVEAEHVDGNIVTSPIVLVR